MTNRYKGGRKRGAIPHQISSRRRGRLLAFVVNAAVDTAFFHVNQATIINNRTSHSEDRMNRFDSAFSSRQRARGRTWLTALLSTALVVVGLLPFVSSTVKAQLTVTPNSVCAGNPATLSWDPTPPSNASYIAGNAAVGALLAPGAGAQWLNLADDDVSGEINVNANFEYFGEVYNLNNDGIYIGSNGWVSFENLPLAYQLVPKNLGAAGGRWNTIYAVNTDLSPQANYDGVNSGIWYEVQGDLLVITWQNVAMYNYQDPGCFGAGCVGGAFNNVVNVQVILHLVGDATPGVVEVVIQDVSDQPVAAPIQQQQFTTGLENSCQPNPAAVAGLNQVNPVGAYGPETWTFTPDGNPQTVTQVQFFSCATPGCTTGGTLVGTDNTGPGPFTQNVSPAVGSHHYYAVATYSNCFTETSNGVTLVVNPNPTPNITAPAPGTSVCAVGTTNATTAFTVGNTYTWSIDGGGTIAPIGPNNNSATITWNNALASNGGNVRTITVTETTPQGCFANATRQITVYRQPTASALITGPGVSPPAVAGALGNPCAGTGGHVYQINPTEATNFSWSIVSGLGGTITNGTTPTATIAWNASTGNTTSQLRCTYSNGPGNLCQATSTVTVLINGVPAPATPVGATNVCGASTGVGYSITNSLGGTFTWSLPLGGGSIAGGQGTPNVTIDWNNVGSTSIRSVAVQQVTAGGCVVNHNTLNVNVFPRPTPALTGSPDACTYIAGTLDAGQALNEYVYTTANPALPVGATSRTFQWVAGGPAGPSMFFDGVSYAGQALSLGASYTGVNTTSTTPNQVTIRYSAAGTANVTVVETLNYAWGSCSQGSTFIVTNVVASAPIRTITGPGLTAGNPSAQWAASNPCAGSGPHTYSIAGYNAANAYTVTVTNGLPLNPAVDGAGNFQVTWNAGVTNGTMTYTETTPGPNLCITTRRFTVTVNPNPAGNISGPSFACAATGGTYTFNPAPGTISPTPTYLWDVTAAPAGTTTGALGGPSLSVTSWGNPANCASFNLTLTVTNAGATPGSPGPGANCITTFTYPVTVYPRPVISSVTPNPVNNICAGQSKVWDVVSAGYPACAPTRTWSWTVINPPAGTPVTSGSTASNTANWSTPPIQLGNTTLGLGANNVGLNVTITDEFPNGTCVSTTVAAVPTFTVNPLPIAPTVTIAPNALCATMPAGVATFTITNAQANTNYTWTPTGVNPVTFDNPAAPVNATNQITVPGGLNGAGTKTYDITATNTITLCVRTTSYSFIVDPTPAPVVDGGGIVNNVCVNGEGSLWNPAQTDYKYPLTSTPVAGNQYNWTITNGFIVGYNNAGVDVGGNQSNNNFGTSINTTWTGATAGGPNPYVWVRWTGPTPGVVKVTEIHPAGCAGTSDLATSKTVNLVSFPAIDITPDAQDVCFNAPVPLTLSTTGVGNTYFFSMTTDTNVLASWTNIGSVGGTGGAAVFNVTTGPAGIITTPGTYYFRVLENTPGCDAFIQEVVNATVFPNPDTIPQSPLADTVCEGDDIPFTVGPTLESFTTYDLERSDNSGASWSVITSFGPSFAPPATTILIDNTDPNGGPAPTGIVYLYRVVATNVLTTCQTIMDTSTITVVEPCVPVFIAANTPAPGGRVWNDNTVCIYSGLEEHLYTYKLDLAASPCFLNTPGTTLTWSVSAPGGSLVTGAIRSMAADSAVVEWYTTGGSQIGHVNATFTLPPAYGSCSATTTFNVTVFPIPQPAITTGPSDVCANQQDVLYSATLQPGDTYSWEVVGGVIDAAYNPGASGLGTSTNPSTWAGVNGNTIRIDWLNQANPSATIKLTQISPANCQNFTIRTITVNPRPTPVISGPLAPCNNDVATYSTQNNAPNATYTWNIVAGASTILSGNGTSSVQLLVNGNTTLRVVETYIATGCVNETQINITPVTKPTPVITRTAPLPGNLTAACLGSSITYSVPANANARKWTVVGGTIVGGDAGASVVVNWTTLGTQTVTVSEWVPGSQCTTTVAQSVIVEPAPAPVISGPITVCATQNYSYSTPLVAGHTYAWSITTGGGVFTTPTNTNMVGITWDAVGALTVRTIQVVETATLAGCATTTTLNVNVHPTPALTPIARIAPPGNANQACLGQNITYSVNNIAGTNYNWTVTGGNVISGQGTNSVVIEWTAIGAQTLTVVATNALNPACTDTEVLNVSVEAQPNPVITGTVVACINTIHTYSTPFVAGNTYQWAITPSPASAATPVYALITGNLTSNTITLQWIQESGTFANPGEHVVAVTETSPSGNCFKTVTMNVRVNPIPNPAITSVTGFGNPNTRRPGVVCNGSTHTYAVAQPMPGNVFFWVVTGGTINSGQNTTSINVTWGAAGVGTIQVTETIPGSVCTTTKLDSIDKRPTPTPVISGQLNPCAGSTQTYETPFVTGNNWLWTVSGPAGTTWAPVPGNPNRITVTWGNVTWPATFNATITVLENVTDVLPTGTCFGNASYNPIVRPNPPTQTISASVNPVCATDLNDVPPTINNVVYSVPAVTGGAVSYAWTLSSNGTIISGQGSNAITVQWTNTSNVATTGNVNLVITSVPFGCTSTSNFNATINPLPNPVISGPTSVCQNSIQSYTTVGVPGNAYNWTVSGGNIIRSGQGTPNITLEWTIPGAATLTVVETIPTTGCSAVNTINVTVNPLPEAVLSASGPTTFCQGGDVTLSAPIGFSNYVWSTGETSRSIVVRTTGQYWVIVTDVNGCSNSSDTIQVNVFPSALPIITTNGPLEFCEGGSVTLTAPAGFSAYQWSNGETTQSIVVTESGEYSVIVAEPNGCTGTSTPVEVIVYAKPTPILTIVGTTTVCSGDTVELRAPAGYVSYTWVSSRGFAYGSDRTIEVTESDTIYCNVVDINGCVGSSDTVEILSSVVVKPIIASNGPTAFCEGGAVVLTAPNGFTQYIWSNGATGRTITVTEAGSFTVTVSDNNLCVATSDPTVVSVNPLPGVPTITRAGDTLTAQSAVAETYQWYRNGTLMPGAVDQRLTVNLPGTYRVEITDENGCSNISAGFAVILTNVNEEPVAGRMADLRVFPNPTTGIFTIETETAASGPVRIELVSLVGETVMAVNETANGGLFRTQVNMNDLANGVYNVVVTTANERWTVRIVRQ